MKTFAKVGTALVAVAGGSVALRGLMFGVKQRAERFAASGAGSPPHSPDAVSAR